MPIYHPQFSSTEKLAPFEGKGLPEDLRPLVTHVVNSPKTVPTKKGTGTGSLSEALRGPNGEKLKADLREEKS